MTTNSAVYKPSGPRPSFSGTLRFTGVTRAVDPDGTITGIESYSLPSPDFSITDVGIFSPDNTAIYNNTITGATYDNVTAFIISFSINLSHQTTAPIITSSIRLNPVGGSDAIVNQILPAEFHSTADAISAVYAVVVYGDSQLASNDLLEQIFTPSTSSGYTTYSGVNFTVNFT